MLADKELRFVNHCIEGRRVDVRLERLRENEEKLAPESALPEVEYQPKGYLRVLKKTLEGEIRPRQ